IDDRREMNDVSPEDNVQRKRKTRRTKMTSSVSETPNLSVRLGESTNDEAIDDNDVPNKDDEKDITVPSKGPSKRQLKREKAIRIATRNRETNKLNIMRKALSYVSMWKHSRSEWKFEKLKQIWLMDNLLDNDSVPDTVFPIVLEYFEGCKGMARQVLLKKGMEIIRKAEEEEDENHRTDIVESIAYERARRLLQALPSDG
ncbi:hypothetical protein HN011_002517, partial [Eciton burchellii]